VSDTPGAGYHAWRSTRSLVVLRSVDARGVTSWSDEANPRNCRSRNAKALATRAGDALEERLISVHSVELGRLVGSQLRHLQVVHQEARRRGGVQNLAEVVHCIRLNQRQRPAGPTECRQSAGVGDTRAEFHLYRTAELGCECAEPLAVPDSNQRLRTACLGSFDRDPCLALHPAGGGPSACE